jgi:hypothetical protein
MSLNTRVHNKSGLSGLSFLERDDKLITSWVMELKRTLIRKSGLCKDSCCLLLPAQDGRYTVQQRKVAYGYQLIAFHKYGRISLSEVEASKLDTSKLISHLCGTRNCCQESHIVIESKAINDERTHCHFAMRNIFAASGYEGVTKFIELGGCSHTPRCGSVILV